MFKEHNVINWQIRNFAYNIDFKFIKQGFVIFSIFFWGDFVIFSIKNKGDFVIFTIPPPDRHHRHQTISSYHQPRYG